MEFRDKILLLKKYRDAVNLAKYYQEEIEQYKQTKMQAKSQQITDMPTVHGSSSDLSEYIAKIDEMEGKMYTKLIKAQRIKTNIMVWCESLEDVEERLIIQYLYIQGHKIGWIADTMVYSEKTIKRKRDKAIEHLPEPDFASLWLSCP